MSAGCHLEYLHAAGAEFGAVAAEAALPVFGCWFGGDPSGDGFWVDFEVVGDVVDG